MFPVEIPRTGPDGFSRCEEAKQKTDYGSRPGPGERTDAAMKGLVDRAIQKDDVLRAIEYDEIDIHVKNGVVYLNGHIVNTASQKRIQTAFRGIAGIRGLQNNLILDDQLTRDVAISLGELEHTYNCKFFTGSTHGVISLNGAVLDENVKLLAEKCASSNPKVRGVINNIRIAGTQQALDDEPFLQPAIGETVYFLDGVSGVVKQVIMNPNNRRVVAMTILGQFPDPRQDLKSTINRGTWFPERLVVLSMDTVRFMTKASGFLHINSREHKRYMDFDSASFRSPNVDWTPPYPYCPGDVLFPIEHQELDYPVLAQLQPLTFDVVLNEQALWEQLLENDSLGG